jgi:hypothetical protein
LTPRSNITVHFIGINPPEEVTPLTDLINGEANSGIGLWRNDLYGVGEELFGKRVKRGWTIGKERDLFVGIGLEDVVEQLVMWDGGRGGNQLFRKMHELPWHQ